MDSFPCGVPLSKNRAPCWKDLMSSELGNRGGSSPHSLAFILSLALTLIFSLYLPESSREGTELIFALLCQGWVIFIFINYFPFLKKSHLMRYISKWLVLYIFQQAPLGPSENLVWQECFQVFLVLVLVLSGCSPRSQVVTEDEDGTCIFKWGGWTLPFQSPSRLLSLTNNFATTGVKYP